MKMFNLCFILIILRHKQFKDNRIYSIVNVNRLKYLHSKGSLQQNNRNYKMNL